MSETTEGSEGANEGSEANRTGEPAQEIDTLFAALEKLEADYRRRFGPIPPLARIRIISHEGAYWQRSEDGETRYRDDITGEWGEWRRD